METLPKNYKNLERLLALMDANSMTHSEFVKAFEVVMQMIRDLKASNETEFGLMRQALSTLSEKLKEDNSEDVQSMQDSCDQMMQDCMVQMEAKMLEMDSKMDSVEDGKTPTIEALQSLIRPIVEDSIVIDNLSIAREAADVLEQNLPAFGRAFRDALELLPEGEKLSPDAIEGLQQALEGAVKKEASNPRSGWGAHPLTIQQSGVTKAKVARIINFTGATVTLAADGTITVAITGGSGWTVETPTGTVNGTNKTFTATNTPRYIVVDGITYFENNGYTLSSLTITTTVAPSGFIRSIY